MSKNSFICIVILLGLNSYANDFSMELLDLSLEDLSQVQISSTANRYKTDSYKSASSVTIINEEEIKRHGYKTLEELLQNVVGFDEAYHIFRPLVSSRGFRQDINSNYLLLIDGHRVNENAYSGFGIAQIFPMMDNIKKVEVIRGASSTLWGGSALNGIISITTKKADEYINSDRSYGMAEGSIDYEIENQRSIINATYAKSSDDYDFTFSALYFDNDADISHLYSYGTIEGDPFYNAQAVYSFKPSYKIYSKLRYKDFQVNLHHSDYENKSNEETSDIKNIKGYGEYLADWIELLYTPKLTDTLFLEARFSYDYKVKKHTREYIDTSLSFTSKKYKDEGYNAEIILHQDKENYHILVGAYLQFHTLSTYNKNKNFHHKIDEKIYAGFSEINYIGFDDWIFTLGGRYEYCDARGDENSFLPRAMIYRQLSDNSYIKYMYNTGSLRPTLITTRGYFYEEDGQKYYAQGAQKSQTSFSNSIQLGYNADSLHLTLTFFYDTIKDLILWGAFGEAGYKDGVPIRLWETNLADITQKGLELEAKWKQNDFINYYATYSYSDATYDDKWVEYEGQQVFSLIDEDYTDDSLKMAGAPEQSWNLGFDWDLTSKLAWNLNYHGRYGVLSIFPNPEWETFSFEHFFDTNVRYVNPFSTNSEISFYAKNITDNRGRFPTGYGEVETQLGRQIGFKLKFIY
jgi:iron complex outermembrane receptor protein